MRKTVPRTQARQPPGGLLQVPRLLDLQQTAQYLGMSPWTVRVLEASGVIPRVVIPLSNGRELRSCSSKVPTVICPRRTNQARRLLPAATLAASGSRLSGESRRSVLSSRPRSSPPSPTPSAASATITVPVWPTTSQVGKSFDCTQHVKRSGCRSGIAPADLRPLHERRDREFVMGRTLCDWIAWKQRKPSWRR